MFAGRTEEVKVGCLFEIEYSYDFTLKKNGLNLDTVRIEQSQIFGNVIVLIEFLKYQNFNGIIH